MAARYLGIDFAWGSWAASGVCVLNGSGQVLDERTVVSQGLAQWIRHWHGSSSVVAVDAPLIVPPDSRALRGVEITLHKRYGARHAGPFPGGAKSWSMQGQTLAPGLRALAGVRGYVVDPFDFAAKRRAIEVFPAPTWLELFSLAARIPYKHGRVHQRATAILRLVELTASLQARDPGIDLTRVDRLAELVRQARTGRDWKEVEDILDARLCAYVALLWDRMRDRDWVITATGDSWIGGYVVVPQTALTR